MKNSESRLVLNEEKEYPLARLGTLKFHYTYWPC